MDIRYPNITGATEAAQLQQVKSYLRQLVDQLNVTLKNVDGGASVTYTTSMQNVATNADDEKNDPVADFNAIKALIIKSADIVSAYYEEINNLLHLSGEFVAESDFGTYKEETSLIINASDKQIQSLVKKNEEIDGSVKMLQESESELRQTASELSLSVTQKVDKSSVISSINVSPEGVAIDASKLATISADKIKLEGYTTINDGFSVDKEGNMTAKGANVSGKVAANEGNVGGWTIRDDKLIATGSVYLNPSIEEAQRALAYHVGNEDIPADKLQAYDIDNNGVVDFVDAMNLYQCATGVKSIEDFPRKQLSTVTVEIDPNNPSTPIHIYGGTNMWGREVNTYISADPAASSFVSKALLNSIARMDLDGGMHRTVEGETEWLNPPMNFGVEYRTAERWNGSAVYTMAVDFGALPNNTEKSKSALAAYLNVIDIRGYAVGASYNVPIPGYYAIQSVGYTKSSGNLWISTTADMSGYNAYVVVKYTK